MKNLKSLAIIGSKGMVGSDLIYYLKSNFENVVGIDRKNYETDVLKLHKMYPLKTSTEYLQDFLKEL